MTHTIRRRLLSAAVAVAAIVGAGCSSDASTATTSPADVVETAGSTATASPSDTQAQEPAPVDGGGEWPPTDACTLLDTATAEALTGQTLSGAPVSQSGEFAYGPSCEFTSDASGLFMVIYTYPVADLATYSEGWIDEGRAVAQPGIGDAALLEMDPNFNNSSVYVTAGTRAFSVQVTSMSDNGWTPQVTTDIAIAVATALVG